MIGGIENFVPGGILSFMLGSAVIGSGSTGNLVPEVAVDSVGVVGLSACFGYFADFVFDGPCPSPPLYFYVWGNLVPIHILLPLILWQHWGLPFLGVMALSLWGV